MAIIINGGGVFCFSPRGVFANCQMLVFLLIDDFFCFVLCDTRRNTHIFIILCNNEAFLRLVLHTHAAQKRLLCFERVRGDFENVHLRCKQTIT